MLIPVLNQCDDQGSRVRRIVNRDTDFEADLEQIPRLDSFHISVTDRVYRESSFQDSNKLRLGHCLICEMILPLNLGARPKHSTQPIIRERSLIFS